MNSTMADSRCRIGVIVFPGVTSLDFLAPLEVFRRIPEAEVVLIGTGPPGELKCDNGLRFISDMSISDEQEPFDVVVVPGG
mmetsp:Transcript_17304/g.48215  ORF Transcript_17304/g.48215 Transcript_17304/m.48215 type:complete len:81 (+) Transcript_17304:58-300(+)